MQRPACLFWRAARNPVQAPCTSTSLFVWYSQNFTSQEDFNKPYIFHLFCVSFGEHSKRNCFCYLFGDLKHSKSYRFETQILMNTSKLSIQIYYFIDFFDFILLEMLALKTHFMVYSLHLFKNLTIQYRRKKCCMDENLMLIAWNLYKDTQQQQLQQQQ